ncbi:hypothetical protein [Rubrivirga sp. IMCC45206]|uniref:hypothetical protein n=1 Tax=Rubrivirga sp. IMCC45206 TaxID=3391614 RepID=UPI00398FD98D
MATDKTPKKTAPTAWPDGFVPIDGVDALGDAAPADLAALVESVRRPVPPETFALTPPPDADAFPPGAFLLRLPDDAAGRPAERAAENAAEHNALRAGLADLLTSGVGLRFLDLAESIPTWGAADPVVFHAPPKTGAKEHHPRTPHAEGRAVYECWLTGRRFTISDRAPVPHVGYAWTDAGGYPTGAEREWRTEGVYGYHPVDPSVVEAGPEAVAVALAFKVRRELTAATEALYRAAELCSLTAGLTADSVRSGWPGDAYTRAAPASS